MDYAGHKASHGKFANQVTEFKGKFKSGEENVGNEILDFLKNWLIDHIQKSDCKYTPFLNEKRK